jgi:hypothetical protein
MPGPQYIPEPQQVPMMPMMPMMPMAKAAGRQYQIGDRVQALYFDNGYTNEYWYDARIVSRVEGKPDTYEIAWEDDWDHAFYPLFSADTVKHENRIRPASEWSTGIFDFSSEPDRSCLALACPCIMFGFMSEMLPPVSYCDAVGKQLCVYAV